MALRGFREFPIPEAELTLIAAAAIIEALQAGDVQFISCHTATEEQPRILVQRNKLSQSPEEIVKDMLAQHAAPRPRERLHGLCDCSDPG